MKYLRKLLPISSVSFWALWGIALFFGLNMFKIQKWENGVFKHDERWYYEYITAGILKGDLTLSFLDNYTGKHPDKFYAYTAPNGARVSKVTCGMALAYLPVFTVTASYSAIKGKDFDEGYSKTFNKGMYFVGFFYLIIGLIVLRWILREYFDDWLTAFLVCIVALSTNIYFYVVDEPLMPHIVNFALFNIFIWLSIQMHKKPGFWRALAWGGILGWMMLIRPTDGLALVFPLLYGVDSFKKVGWKLAFIRENLHWVAVAILGALLAYMPQLIYWKSITGSWLYYSYGGERFFFDKPAILQILFSYRKGWLVYTPIMVFALIGLFFMRKKGNAVAWPIGVFTLLNIYVLSSWWCWWYGGSFGMRAFIGSYGLMMIPMGFFIRWTLQKSGWILILWLGIFASTAYLNIFQSKQYRWNRIHWDGMTEKAYWMMFCSMQYPMNAEGKEDAHLLEEMLNPPNYKAAQQGERFW